MAETSQAKRRVPRFRIPARPRGRVLEILEFQLLDLSVAGARIGHQDPLRVGSVWTFELPKMFRSLILPARVVHSTATGGAKLRRIPGDSTTRAGSSSSGSPRNSRRPSRKT